MTRDTLLERLEEASRRYAAAFARVERLLARVDPEVVTPWVFSVDRLSLDEVREIAPELAEAEAQRRAERVALHAFAETLAFAGEHVDETEPARVPLDDAMDLDEISAHMEGNPEKDQAWRRSLDRFITTVNYARAGGCIYINGTFQPSARWIPDEGESFSDEPTGVHPTEGRR